MDGGRARAERLAPADPDGARGSRRRLASGDTDGARAHLAEVEVMVGTITDPDDQALVVDSLAMGPWYGLR